MELEYVYLGLHRQGEPGRLLAAAFLVDADEGRDLGGGRRRGRCGPATGLAVVGVARVLGDVPLRGIDPQGADAGRLVGPQVVAGHVERAPVRVQPVARNELAEGDHVAPRQVEGTRAGLLSEAAPGR